MDRDAKNIAYLKHLGNFSGTEQDINNNCSTFSFIFSSFTPECYFCIRFSPAFSINLDPENAIWLPGSLEMDLTPGISEEKGRRI